jgi:hypothetical protein
MRTDTSKGMNMVMVMVWDGVALDYSIEMVPPMADWKWRVRALNLKGDKAMIGPGTWSWSGISSACYLPDIDETRHRISHHSNLQLLPLAVLEKSKS